MKTRFHYPRLIMIAILLSLSWTAIPRSQENTLPTHLQLAMILKILPFDRNLDSRVGDEIVLGIIYQSQFEPSLDIKNSMETLVTNSTQYEIHGILFRVKAIDISCSDMAYEISRMGVDILYVTPLRSITLDDISRICRKRKITSFTGVAEYVTSNFAVGFEIVDDKPRIIINRSEAEAEGADFSSQLLKLARVIE